MGGVDMSAGAGSLSAYVDGDGRIAADSAQGLAASGRVLIVDIRTPEEWAQTGVPAGAALASLTQGPGQVRASFPSDVGTLIGGALDKPVALICRTGVRSAFARRLLLEQGFTAVLDIAEGVVGSAFGPGWLARGLAVERWPSPSSEAGIVTRPSSSRGLGG